MCIICNAGVDAGGEFLTEFARAQDAMRKATSAMLECSKVHRGYDKTHKQMLRVLRDWNAIEHGRESTTHLNGSSPTCEQVGLDLPSKE